MDDSPPSAASTPQPSLEGRLAALTEIPRRACIELTSKCPSDCVFCTRKQTRGRGHNMNFSLFESIIRQLGRPERVTLNCIGESVHYPRLGDAIRLVKATGSAAELISTLGAAPDSVLRDIVDAGLDNLHVSLHTVDPVLHEEIYRQGSAAATRAKIDRFLELREANGGATVLDFAFVAIDRNLAGFPDVVAYADSIGVKHISVLALMQPEARRHEFPVEIEGNYLTREFRRRIRETVQTARSRYPRVYIATPNLDDEWPLDEQPRSYPGPLPSGAHIARCYESPWEVVTILTDGDVPACGEDGMEIIGNLARDGLRGVWRSERFNGFRRRHVLGEHPICRICPGKEAHLPARQRGLVARAVRALRQVLNHKRTRQGERQS